MGAHAAKTISDILKKSEWIRIQLIHNVATAGVHVRYGNRIGTGVVLCPNKTYNKGIVLLESEEVSGISILHASMLPGSADAKKTASKIHEGLSVFIAESGHESPYGTVWRTSFNPSPGMVKKLKSLSSIANVLKAFAEHFDEDY